MHVAMFLLVILLAACLFHEVSYQHGMVAVFVDEGFCDYIILLAQKYM